MMVSQADPLQNSAKLGRRQQRSERNRRLWTLRPDHRRLVDLLRRRHRFVGCLNLLARRLEVLPQFVLQVVHPIGSCAGDIENLQPGEEPVDGGANGDLKIAHDMPAEYWEKLK